MRPLRAALAAGFLLAAPALLSAPAFAQVSMPQSGSASEAMRTLQAAEAELRDAIARLDEGTMPASLGRSRLRQALSDVERAMLVLPANARQGSNWQTAVKELNEAMAAAREEGTELATLRNEAGEALATLPALRGAETGSEGG